MKRKIILVLVGLSLTGGIGVFAQIPSAAPEHTASVNFNFERDVMLTGRLAMADGAPPSDILPVGLECVGRTSGVNAGEIGNTMSDLRGEFRFRLKITEGPTADLDSRQLGMSCAVVVTIPGFQSIRKPLAGIDPSMGANVGMLVLRPLSNAAGTLISLNSLKAPEPARKEFVKARQELVKKKLESAQKRLEKATQIYPGYATAWYELGRLQAKRGALEQAATFYRQASAADPNYVSPLIEMAMIAATAQRWAEAEQRSEAILKMAPQALPGIYLVHSIACFNQKEMEAAERSARDGLNQDKSFQFPVLANLLGTILMGKGDKQGAAEAFRQYLERAPQGPDSAKVRQQLEALKN